MRILSKYTDLINGQIEYHAKCMTKAHKKSTSYTKHQSLKARFEEFLVDLEKAQSVLDSRQLPDTNNEKIDPISIRPQDLEGLPPELLTELNLTESDRQEMLIVDVIDSAGGILSLQKLLIGLYHRTGEVYQRQKLAQKLYRMLTKSLIYNAPGRKAVYTTIPPEHKAQDANEVEN